MNAECRWSFHALYEPTGFRRLARKNPSALFPLLYQMVKVPSKGVCMNTKACGFGFRDRLVFKLSQERILGHPFDPSWNVNRAGCRDAEQSPVKRPMEGLCQREPVPNIFRAAFADRNDVGGLDFMQHRRGGNEDATDGALTFVFPADSFSKNRTPGDAALTRFDSWNLRPHDLECLFCKRGDFHSSLRKLPLIADGNEVNECKAKHASRAVRCPGKISLEGAKASRQSSATNQPSVLNPC